MNKVLHLSLTIIFVVISMLINYSRGFNNDIVIDVLLGLASVLWIILAIMLFITNLEEYEKEEVSSK